MFLLVGAGIVLYGGREWLPPLASKHGAGIDAMLSYLLVTTGASLLIASSSCWRGSSGAAAAGRDVTTRFAARRTEICRVARAWAWRWRSSPKAACSRSACRSGPEYFDAAPPADAIEIDVTAQQFMWNVRYPGPDGAFGRTEVRARRRHRRIRSGIDPDRPGRHGRHRSRSTRSPCRSDRPVRVRLHSKDVIHSFFLPHFRVKQDAVPGMTPEIMFVPTRTGSFELACAELCGLATTACGASSTSCAADADFERVLRDGGWHGVRRHPRARSSAATSSAPITRSSASSTSSPAW